jgi:hypothetical protein
MGLEPKPSEMRVLFAGLLDGFRGLLDRDLQTEAAESQTLRRVFEERLSGYVKSRENWAASQVNFADDFNLFRVLDVEYDEVRHSRVLAWLLDRRIEHGTHAQGSLGFRLLLEELKVDLGLGSRPDPAAYADERYWVACEVSGDESRVDIEIAAPGSAGFILHIENKILSVEGPEQTDREWNDLQRRSRDLGIAASNTHAVFLTLGGAEATNRYFHPVAWHRVADVLDRFAREAKAPEAQLFACHYAKAVRDLSIVHRAQTAKEDTDGEDTVS